MPLAPRPHTLVRSRKRRTKVATIALSLIATVIGAHAQSRVPSASRFHFEVIPRIFDGMEISTVRLRSPELTLITDTFGAWIPLEESIGGTGFSLRHRNIDGITLSISVQNAGQASEVAAAWDLHIARTKAQLGDTVVTSGLTDSANGPPASRTIGWRTREATFTWGGETPDEAHMEQHVFTNDGRVIAVFVLSGRAASLEGAMQDFRFFLDRLEPVEEAAR